MSTELRRRQLFSRIQASKKSWRIPGGKPHRYRRYMAVDPRRYARGRAVVFLAAPASASRTGVVALSETLRLPIVQAKVEGGYGHNLISGSYVWARRPHVLYGHPAPTLRNIAIIERVSVGACLLTYRNVYDWVVSMADKAAHKGRSPIGLESDNDLFRPAADVVDGARIVDFVIRYELPWLVRFLNGWLATAQSERIDIVPVEFSQIVSGAGINAFVTALPSRLRDDSQPVVDPQGVGMNIGEPNRGRKALDERQIEAIDRAIADLPDSRRRLLPGLTDT